MSCQISWSSPEEEHLCETTKQPKLWRKFLCIDKQSQDGHLSTPAKSAFKSAKSSVTSSQEVLVSSPCNLSDLEDSPVIGTMQLSDSPLIKQLCISTSPIIGRKRKRRHNAIKNIHVSEPTLIDTANSELKHLTFDKKFGILECNKGKLLSVDSKLSPDIFSEASPGIETLESPNRMQYVISQVNSQHSSIVIDSSTISPQSKPSLESLYFQVPNQKKRRYKRGGLASQALKDLKSERANVAIWKHENYLSKNGEYCISPVDQNLIISLTIQKVWNEFQSTYVLCSNNTCDEFIVLINNEYVDVDKLEIESSYKIYPPYSEHTVPYNNKDIKCYINVTRLKKIDITS